MPGPAQPGRVAHSPVRLAWFGARANSIHIVLAGHPPVTVMAGHPPVTSISAVRRQITGSSPVMTSRGRTPVMTSRGRTPVMTSRGRTPVSTSRSRGPVMTSRGRTPVMTSRGRRPVLPWSGRTTTRNGESPVARWQRHGPMGLSQHRHPAIDVQCGAGDPGSLIRCQVDHRAGNILGLADAAERNLLGELGLLRVVQHLGHGSIDETR
jgi:hypothetical protein